MSSISPQAPCASPKLDALAGLALAADDLPDMLELLRHALVGGDDLVEGIGDLAGEAGLVARQPHREIADPHRLQRLKQLGQIDRGTAFEGADGMAVAAEVSRACHR